MSLHRGTPTFDGQVTLLSEGTDPDHVVTKAYVDAGGDPAIVTQEAFTITVSSGGSDPTTPIKVTSQAEVDAHGDFLTIGAAIAALYDLLLLHTVTIQLPAGTWNVAEGEFDQVWRVKPLWRYYPEVMGMIRLQGDSGWTQLAGTTEELAVSSDSDGNVVLASDPFGATDSKGYFLYVVSGTGAGQFKPIRTHSGVNVTAGGIFSPALDGTSLMRVAYPATKLKYAGGVLPLRGNSETMAFSSTNIIGQTCLLDFSHLDIEMTPTAGGWIEPDNISIRFENGTRILQAPIFSNTALILCSDTVFDTRGSFYPAIDLRGGHFQARSVVHFLGDGSVSTSTITIIGENSVKFMSLGHLSFDGFTCDSFIRISGSLAYSLLYFNSSSRSIRSDQGADYAVKITTGAYMRVDASALFASSTFKGAVADISLDGEEASWDELNEDLPADRVLSNERGSTIMEYVP